MRILHTSDWHIGRKFHQVDLLPDQALFGDWLVELVKAESIDVVVISGDVFDRANPKVEAIDLLDDVLHRLRAIGSSIVMISGNHDSAERLHFGSRFMAGGGLHIATERPDIKSMSRSVTLTGPRGDSVAFLPLPYLDPNRVRMEVGERTHEEVLRQVIDASRSEVADPQRTIIMAHAFVRDSATSESERKLTVGGTGAVPPELFDGFAYVALGHLHKPQPVGTENCFYSGSPLAYSFSEEHDKSVRIIDSSDDFKSHSVKIDVGRAVATIRGTLSELLDGSEFRPFTECFVRAVLTDKSPQLGAMEQLRKRFNYVLDMDQEVLHRDKTGSSPREHSGKRTDPVEVVNEYIEDCFPDDDPERDAFLASSRIIAFEKAYSA